MVELADWCRADATRRCGTHATATGGQRTDSKRHVAPGKPDDGFDAGAAPDRVRRKNTQKHAKTRKNTQTAPNPPATRNVAAGRVRGGAPGLRRGSSLLLSLVFFALCTAGEAARGEHSSRASVTPVVPYASTSVFEGLPDDMVEAVERILDNRLASSSWRKVDAALKYWRPFAAQQGWPTIIRSGDPLRGGKLAGFVTMLVLTTALVYGSITKYVWGLCEWMKLQHQDDPRTGVRGWDNFMKSVKVLTFKQGKPHDRFPIGLLHKMLKAIDKSSFAEVQLGFLLLLLLFTFSRSESPLSKSKEGRECWDIAEHFAWCDIRLVRDRTTGKRVMQVRFKKTKPDQRVERPEAAGDGDWAVVGGVDDPDFDLCSWYILLCSFYPEPLREGSEPFFLDPRLFPDGTRGRPRRARDASAAWTYSQAQSASYALQRRVGIAAGEEFGFHGLRVEGYNLSKRGNGEDLTVAHGLWKSTAHKRYDRFGMLAVVNIPSRMLRARDDVSEASSEEGDSFSSGNEPEETVLEREARPPAARLRRGDLAAPSSGGQSSRAPHAEAALLPEGWWTERRTPASGNSYAVHYGPSGQRASTRPEAWRIADEAERADEASPSRTPSPPSSAQADNPPSARGRGRSAPRSAQRSSQLSSGPVPLNVTDLARHQTFMQRPSMRRAPTARHR